VVLANDNVRARQPADYPAAPVRLDLDADQARPRLVTADVVDDDNAHRHDPGKLAAHLFQLAEEQAPARAAAVARPA
jgi:hypothetical protein